MTSFELLAIIEELLTAFDPSRYLLELIAGWNDASNQLLGHIDALVELEQGNLMNANNAAKKLARDIIPKIKEADVGEFYGEIGRLEQELRHVHPQILDYEAKWLSWHLSKLREFRAAFERFIKDQTPGNLLPLLRAAMTFRDWVAAERSTLKLVRENLTLPADVGEGEDRLELLLDTSFSLSEIAQRLADIDSLYAVVCGVLRVSTAAYPLRAKKIETGSLFLTLVGNQDAMIIIGMLIGKAVELGHRRFTHDGQMQQAGIDARTVADVFEKVRQARDGGVDTTKADEHLSEAFENVAQTVARLTRGSASVRLNGKWVGTAPVVEVKLAAPINGVSQRLLGNSPQSNGTQDRGGSECGG